MPQATTSGTADSFVGREAELAELAELLENPACRLITIVGPGGIGKTRLALAAAAEQAEMFPHGAAFVPLAAISSAEFLAPAIMAALDIPSEGQRDPRDQLLDYLRERAAAGAGQLRAGCSTGAELLADILQRAPGVTLLVTSRERLALQGEWLFDLEGLSYPTDEAIDEHRELQRGAAVYAARPPGAACTSRSSRRGARRGAHLPAGRRAAAGDRAGRRRAARALLRGDRDCDRDQPAIAA